MNILLVDDSKSARYALRLQLQRYGVKVETEDAAESALERIQNTPPDAIFMDHTMPGMNGFEALGILKAEPTTKHIPIVMCTSNEDPEFIAQAMEKGAMDILSKSTAPEKLANLLERLQNTISEPEPVSPPEPAAPPPRPTPSVSEITEAVPDFPTHHEPLPQVGDTLSEEKLQERIRTLTRLHIDELAARLTEDLIAKTDKKLISRLEEEAERLQKHFIKTQNEQAQLTTSRLVNDVLPQFIRQQLDQERQQTAQMVQSLVDESVDALIEEPGFLRRLLDPVEATATASAEKAVRLQAQEIAKTIASESVGQIPEILLESSSSNTSSMYLLATGAALVGVASAAVVFFLLS